MSELTLMIGIALLVVVFMSLTSIPNWLDFKPFNCATCLSFWASVICMTLIIALPETKTIITILSYGGYSVYIGMVAKRFLFKI